MAAAPKREKRWRSGRFDRDVRALSPAIGKTLELGIVVLFVSLLSGALYGGAIPDYRTSAAAEVGDRTLVAAAERIEDAVPPNAASVRTEVHVDVPRTIRGEPYRLRVRDETLVLDHPNRRVAGRTPLALPNSVVAVSGAWSSGDDPVVVVRKTERGLTVELVVNA